MSIQYFKKERGGVNPVGPLSIHLYKDPPKGIFTRKYEPVNIADVQYMVQADAMGGDPTRINEGIQVFARGQNPMVEVSYQNAGGASTNSSLGNAQVSNPYKVEVVRPPLMPLEVLQPISAPRMHQNYTITTNPGIYPQSVAGEYDKAKVRLMTQTYTTPAGYTRTNINSSLFEDNAIRNSKLSKVMNDLLQGQINPTYSYNLDNIRDTSTKYVTETKDLTNIAATTPLSFTDIVVFDPRTNTNVNVEANIKEKNAIAVSAAAAIPIYFNTNDGQTIKLKDYEYKVVQAPYGNQQMVIYVRQPEIQLNRNTPLYAAQATVSLGGLDYSTQRAQADKLTLESVLPLITATSSIKLSGDNDSAYRSSVDPSKRQMDWLHLPKTTATASISLLNKGYNEENWRQGAKQSLDKQAHYGVWDSDRTAKVDPSIRGITV
jgi:hypothetical protein